jgi:hypothetical protein
VLIVIITPKFLASIEKEGISIKDRVLLIAENMGMLAKLTCYATRFPEERDCHIADMKLAIGDIICQLELLCINMGFDHKEIRQLGREHTFERFEDFQKRGWK